MAQRTKFDKSYLRGALWVTALAALVCLPAPTDAAGLTVAEAATNNVVAFGAADPQPPTEWLGPTPHFVMVGAYKDYRFAIDVRDLDAAEGIAATGKREYRASAEGPLAYVDFEVAANLVTEGIERSIELEFENADFSKHAAGTRFVLQGAEFPAGLLSNMELEIEWEWVEKSIIVNAEQLYVDGALTVAHESGVTGADGTMPNGMIGGFVTAMLDGQAIAISFSVPVTEAEIDD